MPAAGGAAHLLVADKGADSRPLFSPGGDKLAFVSDATGDGDIYLLELASGKLSRVTYADGRDELSGWSRNGQWIYFSSGRAGQGQRSGCGGRDAVAAVGALARGTLRAPRQVKP